MEQKQLRKIGYQKYYYGVDLENNTKQCSHCKYEQSMKTNREKLSV